MIKNFLTLIKRYWCSRILLKLESQLLKISEKNINLERDINELGSVEHYIPLAHIKKVKDQFDNELIIYFHDDDLLAFPDKKLRNSIMKIHSFVKINPRLEHVFKKHKDTRDKYLTLYAAIEDLYANIEDKIQNYTVEIEQFHQTLLKMRNNYISHSITEKVIADFDKPLFFYKHAKLSEITDETFVRFKSVMEDIWNLRKEWNQEFILRELENQKDFFSDIDGKSLDEQQRIAVITDEDNNLVLAGAGSGKTLTIAAKVKYLVEKKGVNPQEILLLSFTKKTVLEMKERINEKLNLSVNVRTFHSLGMGIIRDCRHKSPNVLEPEKNNIIDLYLKDDVLKDETMLMNIVTFFGIYLNIPKDRSEFENLGEYHEQSRNIDLVTLKGKIQKLKQGKQTIQGEKTKSLEETIIANFLFLNGINYEYERDYEYETADKYHRQYQPDFFLPDCGIYIEHFGITEQNTTPWLSEIEQTKYLKGMTWKRRLHREKHTQLIETYSYYNKNGMLLSKLEEKLRDHGVQFKPVDVRVIFQAISNQENTPYYMEFAKLSSNFVNLFKSNGYDASKFQLLKKESEMKYAGNEFFKKRNAIFFDIVEEIYTHYQETLQMRNQIDFNDMINEATENAELPDSSFDYRYIIIDEYQDISQSRFKLIKAIKAKTNATILCVGDDWQSIYRFAGSDLDLFTNFSAYFGYSELLRIEKTYRNSQELIDIAGSFIMKNEKQFKKKLRSNKSSSYPIKLIKYDNNKIDALRYLLEIIANGENHNQTIMLLGRNNGDIKYMLEDQDDFTFNIATGEVTYRLKKNIKLFFLTVHKSKGIEADQVILINAENKLTGFPNKISDDPLLHWVLTNPEEMQFAEERRLFYVALTRTKNNLFIIVPESDRSLFVKEIEKDYGPSIECNDLNVRNKISDNPLCPKCGTGKLIERLNQNQDIRSFVGCSNYPGCDQTYNDVRLISDNFVCSCGGFMVRRRSGRNSEEFLGCTNFPHCNNTMNIG